MKLRAPAGEPGATARSRPSAEHVATAVMALCLVLFGVVHATTDVIVLSLFSLAPLVAATVADERRTAVFAGAAVALAIGAGWRDGAAGDVTNWIRVGVIPTGHGIRVIIGDVRGKGLDAVLLARHVLSAFRRSAVALPALEHVAGEVGRAIGPHLGQEDFVTAALAQIAPCGELTVVNCGHHPPLLRHRGDPCC
jgi:hypothetical protein